MPTKNKINISPKITAVQLNSQQNIEQNFNIAKHAIIEAKQQGASLVVLPENVCSMGRQRQTAERYDELVTKFSTLAHEQKIYLVAGTLPCRYRPNGEKVAGDKLRQVSLLFAPDGTQVARYDKVHLFRAMVNDHHGNYDESLTFEAGDKLVTAPIELHGQTYHIGMMVCFDLRFPKMAQNLRQIGADILTVPSAFTYQTGKENWSLLLKARALDSQCIVVGAGQGGEHHYKEGSIRSTWGHTAIASCEGEVLSQYDSHLLTNGNKTNLDTEVKSGIEVKSNTNLAISYQLVHATFDNKHQQKKRQQLPIFNCHRLV